MDIELNSLFSLRGKVALVTGGSRGIGEMIATGYVQSGVKTYISSRKADACAATAERLSQYGVCIALPADISRGEGIRQLAAELAERESQLDILVNNAGATWGAPLESYPEEGWDKVMAVNIRTPFFLVQHLLPLLKKSAKPDHPARIINMGSISGMHANHLPAFAYGASKAALHHLTSTLAYHFASDNINVNAIAPGPFESKMMAHVLATTGDEIVSRVPRKRIGRPEDIVGASIYLASRASDYVTGITLPVDGGITGTL